MKKALAIVCTVGFGVFWVFAGLTVLAWLDANPLLWLVAALSALGLGVGVVSRLRLNALTKDLKRGLHVRQDETAHP